MREALSLFSALLIGTAVLAGTACDLRSDESDLEALAGELPNRCVADCTPVGGTRQEISCAAGTWASCECNPANPGHQNTNKADCVSLEINGTTAYAAARNLSGAASRQTGVCTGSGVASCQMTAGGLISCGCVQ